jgi:hypothetical protein
MRCAARPAQLPASVPRRATQWVSFQNEDPDYAIWSTIFAFVWNDDSFPTLSHILATAKALNPNIKVFQAKRNAKGVIAFDIV